MRCTPQGEYFYGTLVQNAAAAQWQSMDGKQHRSVEAAQTVSMERRVPELDFVTECDNRVWGCNSKENVIYGCKLGDPTNWFSYRGIAAGQLRRHRGQRWCLYRGSFLHGLCAVL